MPRVIRSTTAVQNCNEVMVAFHIEYCLAIAQYSAMLMLYVDTVKS